MAIKKAQRYARAVQNGIRRSSKNIEHQKQEKKVKPKDKKVLIVAQEIKFARLLACNDKKVRDKVLKNLKKWLTVRSKSSFQFVEADFMRLWKGLFYCMWMSDKPLIQEELAESLSNIVHCFDSMPNVLLYNKCALKTLAIEWFGIDQYRLDKFAMLVRRILRQTFKVFNDKKWNIEWVRGFVEILEQLLLDEKCCLGFKMHVTELYWEEIAKISHGKVPEDVVTELIKPFVVYMTTIGDERLIKHIMKHIFRYLIFQSDVGLDYKEKFEAWKQAGFPCGSIDVMEKIEEPDEDSEEENDMKEFSEEESENNVGNTLDPRAGRVDVELPQINFDAKKIAELIKQYRFHPSSTAKSRRQIARLIQEFTEVSEGRMPLGIKEIKVVNKYTSQTNPKKAAMRLLKFEEELYSDDNGIKRKRKKNGELDEGSFDESQENVTNEKPMEESKKTNNKKKKSQDLKCKLDETDQIMQSSLKDSEIAKKPTSITDRVNNKQKKQEDRLENETLKRRKCTVDTIAHSKVNKNKIIKKKSNVNNEKTVSKNVAVNKTKKLKKLICGQWDVSDNGDQPASPTATSSKDNKNKKTIDNKCNTRTDTSTLNDKTDTTLDKQIAWLRPAIEKSMAPKKHLREVNKTPNNSGAKKRVKIVLQRNTAQRTSDYIQQIRLSPAIPFDANRKPLVGVLKASPIPSPVNPFYKRQAK
ncbi:hypothetical protein KPH14_010544 [Odynerus spinipes]|uniref:Ribosomal RNA processing protein 1 homolog n=1 Tax=Odynerus spinipes TaxID=1348599 RepID=A0AAD9RU50_9HYME|nr:hypothetical protein KPH14_010544 [Odynerus spinipes]